MTDDNTVPLCPLCSRRCRLDSPSCIKGMRMQEMMKINPFPSSYDEKVPPEPKKEK